VLKKVEEFKRSGNWRNSFGRNFASLINDYEAVHH
jgi:hypothetical protein